MHAVLAHFNWQRILIKTEYIHLAWGVVWYIVANMAVVDLLTWLHLRCHIWVIIMQVGQPQLVSASGVWRRLNDGYHSYVWYVPDVVNSIVVCSGLVNQNLETRIWWIIFYRPVGFMMSWISNWILTKNAIIKTAWKRAKEKPFLYKVIKYH